MSKDSYRISPLTLIEGHLELVLTYDSSKKMVKDVRLCAYGFRGFEKLLLGLSVDEVPSTAQRICGVCCIAHHVAAAKAISNALGLEIPDYALLVLKLINNLGIVQSHLIHILFMALPDILRLRSINDVAKLHREILLSGVKCLHHIQRAIEVIGGSPIHPSIAIPGGISRELSNKDIEIIRQECRNASKLFNEITQEILEKYEDFIKSLSTKLYYTNSLYMCLKGSDPIEFFEGPISIHDSKEILHYFEPSNYREYIREFTVSYSYSKLTRVLVKGNEAFVRVGPLARVLLSRGLDVNRDLIKLYLRLRSTYGTTPLLYTLSRIIEVSYILNSIDTIIDSLSRVPHKLRSSLTSLRSGIGVGVVEAPRGLLIHEYRVNSDGLITYANIVTPTVHNLSVMELDAKNLASKFISTEGFNAKDFELVVKSLIRSYDPCISCATHFVKVIIR